MTHDALATPGCRLSTDGDGADGAGGGQYRWELLVPRALHPMQVAIVEALSYLDRPLSPSQLRHVFDKAYTVSHVDYHVNALAQLGALELVAEEPVRGVVRHVYSLKEPGSA